MKHPSIKLGLLFWLLILAARHVVTADSIRISGSDFAGTALRVNHQDSGAIGPYAVDYRMTGSLMGLIKLQEGFADVAFILQTSEGHPSVEGLASVPLGFWGIYFAVQKDNPLNEVSVELLSDVLRKTRDGLKSEWGVLLPGEPKWTNRLVFVTFDLKETEPSYPILVNRFFDNQRPEKFSSLGERIENPYLAGASNLLVLSRLPQPGKGLRLLSLIADGQNVGFPPSGESMFFGDYSLKTTLLLVGRDKDDAKFRAFLADFFEKKRVQALVQTGMVPVPQNVQKQALLGFDLDF